MNGIVDTGLVLSDLILLVQTCPAPRENAFGGGFLGKWPLYMHDGQVDTCDGKAFMRRRTRISMVLAAAVCVSCTYASLSTRGSSVTEVVSAPGANCENFGAVYGKGGGLFGEFVSNDTLLEYAINDARNKAAELGATHLQFTAPQMGVMGFHGGTTTTTATVVGVAFRCPTERPIAVNGR